MARLCAPARDAEVAALRDMGGLVPRLRGMMECLSRMQRDMANFNLASLRPVMAEHGVRKAVNLLLRNDRAKQAQLFHALDHVSRILVGMLERHHVRLNFAHEELVNGIQYQGFDFNSRW